MNLSAPFIRRPVMTTLVTVSLLLAGIFGYTQLPVSDLPNIDFPTITVTASLPGANPDTMASAVATPLERQFAALQGLDAMNSTSTNGATRITMQFALDRSIDAAAQDVQTAIAAASRQLPSNMPSPPTLRKVNPADAPVLYLAVHSPTLPLSDVDEAAQTTLAQRLSGISGVAQISVFGAQKYAVRAQVDPQALSARGIGIDEVANAVQQGNSNRPTGTLNGPSSAYQVRPTNGQLMTAAGYRDLVVTYRNGAPVHLGEIAKVSDSVENDKLAGWFNDERSVVLAIQRQPGANTVGTVDAVLKELPALKAQLPAAMQVDTVYNRAESIRHSVIDVQATLVLTMVLVIAIIYFFLRTARATLIPSLALPASIVATFAVMRLLNFNLDNLSLMALTLATGFVVDDAIVMLENIVRHVEQGEQPLAAALKGSKEIGFTILSMTVSLVAVFIPILFMSGIVGRLFNEFALTLTGAILLSGVISLTLTPMMASRLLKPVAGGAPHGGESHQQGGRLFNWLARSYAWALTGVMRHQRAGLAASLALVLLTGWAFVAIPKGFIPSEDTGRLMGITEAAPGISFPEMMRHQQEIAKIAQADPNVQGVISSAGASALSSQGNNGMLFIHLKPRRERSLGADQVIDELRPKFAQVAGIRVYLQNPPSIRIGGMPGKSQYQVALKGADPVALYGGTEALYKRLREIPQLQDVASDIQAQAPEIALTIHRDRAAALNVTPDQIEMALYSAYGSRQVTQIYGPTNQYQVILEVDPAFQSSIEELGLLQVRSSTGKLVPLSAVADLKQGMGPVQITHLDQMPATTLSFNLKAGVSLSEATRLVEGAAQAVLPPGIVTEFQGSSQAFKDSMGSMGWLLLLALVVIYLILGMLYESYIHPLTVLAGLPSAGLGALLTLMAFGKELDLYAFLGLILLIGIVKKNAIMLIDFALVAMSERGASAEEAILEACQARFRPIMMTTMAALMGALPIAFGLGAGGEARQGLGLAVTGGLAVSQVLTLLITPVMFVAMDRLQPRKSAQAQPVAAELPV